MLKGGRAGGDIQALQKLLVADDLGATAAEAVANTRRDKLKIIENPPGSTGGVTPVQAVAMNSAGDRIVTGNADDRVRIWDAGTGQLVHEFEWRW